MAPFSKQKESLEKVRRVLQAQPALSDASVRLTLQVDSLRLEGKVATHYQKHLAERLLAELEGVRVVNDLEVERRPTSPFVVKCLYKKRLRRSSLPPISAQVEGRTVHLAGRVDSWREREQAEQLALALPGIHTVVNSLRLEP